jgi:predicted ATPase
MERLTRIEVNNLFGYLNQDIALSTDTGITVLHGANGSGKTTLLRCINDISQAAWYSLSKRPFEKLTLHFESGARLDHVQDKEETAKITLVGRAKKPQHWSLKQGLPDPMLRVAKPGQAMRSKAKAEDAEGYELLTESDLEARYTHYITKEFFVWNQAQTTPVSPDWLESFRKEFRCTLIEEQRLIRVEQEERTQRVKRVVGEFSKSIMDTIGKVHGQYGERSQQLERSFIHRVVETLTQTPPESFALEEKYREVEQVRQRLQAIGLLDQEPAVMHLDQPSLSRSDIRRVLSLYADDMKVKLSLFSALQRKTELFESLLNDYFAHKTVRVSRKGIQIQVTETGSDLDATALSSGEQHILVLFFTLIFKEAGEHRLVLIDEPELSLHPRWQLRFIDDLERIREVSNLDFILASHSPLIFQGHMVMARGLQI